jgi:uncharacterized phage protein gp47/JayE
MSFAAEPYGTFVEDLLANLTGGESRVRFTFVDDELPFRLAGHERVRPASVRAHGISEGAFTEFVAGRDFQVDRDGTITWAGSPGFNLPGAVLPDAGTDVWVGFDRLPGGSPPLLNDRNPGSVLRTLAESFAREFAVLSQQLDLVYDAAFVETAAGRDLDQVAALVGLERRGATHAVGEVVFRRSTPAPAEITIPAGTLVSTAEAPNVTVETTDTVSLRRGTFSAAAPVRAKATGPEGVATERRLTVVHRPIFGVDEALNPEPMSFGGGSESDEELRSRVRRALDTGGRSTVGAIRGALSSLEGIREQDVLLQEDHLTSPGLVNVTVAAEVTESTAILASRLLEDYRPAGVRIVHNLPAPTTPLPTLAEDTGGGGDGPIGEKILTNAEAFVSVKAKLVLTPADLQLSEERRQRLSDEAKAALIDAVAVVGPGEPVVYNRLVAAVMAVEGVLDAVLDIGFPPADETLPIVLRRFNLPPVAHKRARLKPEELTVEMRGDRVLIDVMATVERGEETIGMERGAAIAAITQDLENRLLEHFQVTRATLDPAEIKGSLPDTDKYAVETIGYHVELVDEGLRVSKADVVLRLDPGQVVWVRSVSVSENAGTLP